MPTTPAHRRAVTSVVGQSSAAGRQQSFATTEELVHYPIEIFQPESVADGPHIARAFERVQQHARQATQSARSLPVLGGVYWPSVQLVAGITAPVPHDLGITVSFLVASMRPTGGAPPAIVTEVGQSADGNVLSIKATYSCTVDLWIYPRPNPIGATPINVALGQATKSLATPLTFAVASGVNNKIAATQSTSPLLFFTGTLSGAGTVIEFPNVATFWICDISAMTGFSAVNTLQMKSGTTTVTVINTALTPGQGDDLIVVVTTGANGIRTLGGTVSPL